MHRFIAASLFIVGALLAWPGTGRADAVMYEIKGKVIAMTKDGRQALVQTKTEMSYVGRDDDDKKVTMELTLIALVPRRKETRVCRKAGGSACEVWFREVKVRRGRKGAAADDDPAFYTVTPRYRALRGKVFVRPLFSESLPDGTDLKGVALLAKGYQGKVARKGDKLVFTLVKGSSVIALGEVEAQGKRFEEASSMKWFLDNQFVIFTVKEITNRDDGVIHTVTAEWEVPFRVAYPSAGGKAPIRGRRPASPRPQVR